MSFQVEFNGEKVISVGKGQTILDASLAAGIPHYHACGGKAQCTTCRIMVLEGEQQLSSLTTYGRTVKAVRKLPDNVRLSC